MNDLKNLLFPKEVTYSVSECDQYESLGNFKIYIQIFKNLLIINNSDALGYYLMT